MLFEELATAWRKQARDSPIESEPAFSDDSVVLGAGTVLARRADFDSNGDAEVRLLTLLTVAYGRDFDGAELKHIRRSMARWLQGDATLARVHMALAKVGRLPDSRDAARRLFMADRLLCMGAAHEVLRDAVADSAAASRDPLQRYSPDQPRVAAGNGRESGRWTSDGSDGEGSATNEPARVGADAPEAASSEPQKAPSAGDAAVNTLSVRASPLAEQAAKEAAEKALERVIAAARQATGSAIETLTADQLAELAAVSRLPLAATVFAGVLLTPTNATFQQRHDVPGRPGFFYERYPGELGWHVFFTKEDGEPAELPIGPDGVFRDAHGQAIARYLPDGGLVLDVKPHLAAGARERSPKLCPAPTPDRFGQGVGSRSKAYENQMKPILNPEHPTPPDFGRSLPLSSRPSGTVIFDDCWLKTGDMFEYKGQRYAALVAASSRAKTTFKFANDWLDQSQDQVLAAGDRRVIWCFAEQEAASYAYDLFQKRDKGRERIIISVFPYLGE